MKSNSRIFNQIRELVKAGNAPSNFRVKDVLIALGTSRPFLSKHAIDPNDNTKKAEGNPYFSRIQRGLYKINPIWL